MGSDFEYDRNERAEIRLVQRKSLHQRVVFTRGVVKGQHFVDQSSPFGTDTASRFGQIEQQRKDFDAILFSQRIFKGLRKAGSICSSV